jgi:cytochrome c oxidase assembly protein subunit 15
VRLASGITTSLYRTFCTDAHGSTDPEAKKQKGAPGLVFLRELAIFKRYKLEMNMKTSAALQQDLSDINRHELPQAKHLGWYTKLLVVSVLGLIFFGALVTSHDAGLAVPDWPTSYGQNMFLFPPSEWVGGVFYEHVHRLLASGIGLLTLILAAWLALREKRVWVKKVGALALLLVCVQGLLGGLTVIYKLPDALSVSHGMLAQTFFCLTIFIAYLFSSELEARNKAAIQMGNSSHFRAALIALGLVYSQLLLGAILRHSGSGLAIPDFPTIGGSWLPSFDDQLLATINEARRGMSLSAITMSQIFIHLLHRLWAVVVLIGLFYCGSKIVLSQLAHSLERRTALTLLGLVFLQFTLGILTVLTGRQPYITSLHVMIGAALLGINFLLVLRTYPYKSGVRTGNSD